jgi:hypothetical protein
MAPCSWFEQNLRTSSRHRALNCSASEVVDRGRRLGPPQACTPATVWVAGRGCSTLRSLMVVRANSLSDSTDRGNPAHFAAKITALTDPARCITAPMRRAILTAPRGPSGRADPAAESAHQRVADPTGPPHDLGRVSAALRSVIMRRIEVRDLQQFAGERRVSDGSDPRSLVGASSGATRSKVLSRDDLTR